MNDFIYAAIVADRSNISEVLLAARMLDEPTPNDGWTMGAQLFEGLDNAQYLLLIAPDRLRCINGASLAHLCGTEEIFRGCMGSWMSQLEGEGRWLTFGTADTKALVDSIALASAAKGECILSKAVGA
jgi:hypothetical protein